MALLFMEGFDHHGTIDGELQTTIPRKWPGSTSTADGAIATGVFGSGNAIYATGGEIMQFDLSSSVSTIIVGFHFKHEQS